MQLHPRDNRKGHGKAALIYKILRMAFSDFDLKMACERFGLKTDERQDLFSSVSALKIPSRLGEFLDVWAPAALTMNTEKARSEMIIAPILMEAVQLSKQPVSLFSGVSFDVDKDQGLNGARDYLLTNSYEQILGILVSLTNSDRA